MPTYEYACRSCGEHLEVVQSFRDEPLSTCPSCEGPLRKVFGSIGIAFKGSGFYKTDSRSDGPKRPKTGDAKSGDGKASDGKAGGDGKASDGKAGGDGKASDGKAGGGTAAPGRHAAAKERTGSGSAAGSSVGAAKAAS
ncbi:MAG: FmdB family zinc ribbon protein [Acidimicrobiales bacterium]